MKSITATSLFGLEIFQENLEMTRSGIMFGTPSNDFSMIWQAGSSDSQKWGLGRARQIVSNYFVARRQPASVSSSPKELLSFITTHPQGGCPARKQVFPTSCILYFFFENAKWGFDPPFAEEENLLNEKHHML